MKQFTINHAIQTHRHYHIPFKEAIAESWELLQSGTPYTIFLPPKSGKSSIIQNLHQHALKNSSDIVFLLDFNSFTRTDFSTIEKFNTELKRLLLAQARNYSDQLVHFIERSRLDTLEDLFILFSELTKFQSKKYYLLIDDADKHSRHDTFTSFLGLILHSIELAKSRINTAFSNVAITASKKINGFRPYERANSGSEYFKTWGSTILQTNYIKADENIIENYLNSYADEIKFELDPKTVEQLIKESSGKLLPINKMLKFYDEKIRIYKKKKIITPEEMQHAAGYALAPAPF